MYLVGLTGGVATGKSTVSNMFRELGVPVFDADAMARRIVEPGRKAWRAIKEEFGPCVFHDNGELNRAALRTIIFEVCELFMSADVHIALLGRGTEAEAEQDHSPGDLQRDGSIPFSMYTDLYDSHFTLKFIDNYIDYSPHPHPNGQGR